MYIFYVLFSWPMLLGGGGDRIWTISSNISTPLQMIEVDKQIFVQATFCCNVPMVSSTTHSEAEPSALPRVSVIKRFNPST